MDWTRFVLIAPFRSNDAFAKYIYAFNGADNVIERYLVSLAG